MDPTAELIRDGRALLGLDREQVIAQVGGSCAPSAYGPREGLEVVVAPPFRVYLADGIAALVYRAAPAVPPSALLARYPDAVSLPSRAGRGFAHRVEPAAGLAWSEDREQVAFVEWFAPTDLPTYRARWWSPPAYR